MIGERRTGYDILLLSRAGLAGWIPSPVTYSDRVLDTAVEVLRDGERRMGYLCLAVFFCVGDLEFWGVSCCPFSFSCFLPP